MSKQIERDLDRISRSLGTISKHVQARAEAAVIASVNKLADQIEKVEKKVTQETKNREAATKK